MFSPTSQPSPHDSNSPLSPPALSAAELFRSCASGNCERAWREFVARFHARLVTSVRRALLRQGDACHLGGHAERVEDLVQEVYCRLLGDGSRRCRFRGDSEGQLMTYLQRVAVSVVVDARREALAAKRCGGHRVPWGEGWSEPSAGGEAEGGPEDRLLARERRREFLTLCRQALGRRADATNERIARLALLEGWTSREISAGLGGAPGVAAIDSLICHLRRSLADRGISLPRRDRLPDN